MVRPAGPDLVETSITLAGLRFGPAGAVPREGGEEPLDMLEDLHG